MNLTFLHDPVTNHNTAIAIPLGMHGGDVATPPTSTRELFTALTTAEKFFWHYLKLYSGHCGIVDCREASVAIALIRAYEVALGAKHKNVATVVASLLGELYISSPI